MGAGRYVLAPVALGLAVLRLRGARPTDPPATAPGSGDPVRPTGQEPRLPSPHQVPGVTASTPKELPKGAWKQILKRAWKETQQDNVPLLAAGVAFWGFVSIFPALIAAITVYGLVADPEQVQQQVQNLTEALPEDTAELIGSQLEDIAGSSGGALGLGLLASVAGALFTASGGVSNLMKAVNIAYDEGDSRGFVKQRAIALLLTLGAVVFVAVAVGLIAVLPVVLGAVGLEGAARLAVNVLRWVGLVAFVLVALGVVYRVAPDRDSPRVTWLGTGSIVATVLWLLGSAGFSVYVNTFGTYGETYGALAGVVVLLLWLFLTSFVVLFGAEINSEMEQQTAVDTTRGAAEPMGSRRAVKADTIPSPS